jgi:hypothetical protein
MVQEYQVQIPYCTYKPVYEKHVRQVPEVKYQCVTEYRNETRVSYVQEPVYTEKCVKVCGGHWEERTECIPGPIVTKCCRLPGTYVFDPCTCTTKYCPGEVVRQQYQCPPTTVTKKVWVPTVETKIVKECKMVCKPVCTTVQVPCTKMVPYTTYRDCSYTTCRMVAEQHCRTETRKRCYTVPEECVRQIPYTTCKMVAQQHTRMVTKQHVSYVCETHVRRIPYTTCKMVTQQHVRTETRRSCTMQPYTVTKQIPYTTCRIVQEQHVRTETRRRCYTVPEEKVRYVPYTTCKMVPEECSRVQRCYRTRYEPQECVRQVPYTTCRMEPQTCVRMVPKTTCSMEPYTVCYKTCKMVPVCETVCEDPCPPVECTPVCAPRLGFLERFSRLMSRGCCK